MYKFNSFKNNIENCFLFGVFFKVTAADEL